MTDRLDLAFTHAADLGLLVEWEDLGDNRRGYYQRHLERIVLNCRLTAAQSAATLIHEVGHHVFGDWCSSPRAERRAWEFGASLLIEVEEYAKAEEIVGCHPAALALELEVTPRLIEAWRRWYLRRFPIEVRHHLATSEAVEGPFSRSDAED